MALPTPKGNISGKLPAPSSNGSANFAPFLKVEHIGKGATLKAVGNVRDSGGKFGAGIVLDVALGKKTYSMTVKFESGNYSRLYEMFGADPKRWKGKSFKVVRAEYLGKEYVQVAS